MIAQTAHPFWDFNIGNLLTLVALLAGFFGWLLSKNSHSALLHQRMMLMEEWRDKHEDEAGKRDHLISELDKCVVRLTMLAETAERRLLEIERRR